MNQMASKFNMKAQLEVSCEMALDAFIRIQCERLESSPSKVYKELGDEIKSDDFMALKHRLHCEAIEGEDAPMSRIRLRYEMLVMWIEERQVEKDEYPNMMNSSMKAQRMVLDAVSKFSNTENKEELDSNVFDEECKKYADWPNKKKKFC